MKKLVLLGIFPLLGKTHSEILPVLQARSAQDKKSQPECEEGWDCGSLLTSCCTPLSQEDPSRIWHPRMAWHKPTRTPCVPSTFVPPLPCDSAAHLWRSSAPQAGVKAAGGNPEEKGVSCLSQQSHSSSPPGCIHVGTPNPTFGCGGEAAAIARSEGRQVAFDLPSYFVAEP